MVTLQNYEEYMMLFVDEELNAAEVKELMEFIKLHPELEAELEAYKKTKLPAATELIYPDKTKLLKQPKTINLNRWLVYGVAAGIALLIVFTVGKWISKPANIIIETPEVAKKTEPITAPVNPQIKDEPQPAPVKPVNQSTPIAKVKTYKPATTVKKATPTVNVPNYRTETVIYPADITEKQEPEIAKTATEEVRPATTEPVPQPEEIQQPERKRTKRNLLAMLPISSEKKEGLQHLRNTVEEKVEAVKTINDNLKNTSFELKLGNKELFVINL